MRVRDEDVVLIRLYREPPDIGKRSAARESLDALLGTMLEFVPASDAEAWAIVPVASVHDVWKLEDDVRKRGRYFVNQFVGAYRPTEDAADEDAEDDAVDEAV
jgi:recombinational DNA repair protein RecR